MAKHRTSERTHRDRTRPEWDDQGREQERGQRFGEYEEVDDEWRRRTPEYFDRQTSRREGGWRPSEYGRDEGEHFPWGGGEGPVRWSEGRRGHASEEDWRGSEQTFDDRTRGTSRGRQGRGASEPYGRYGQGQYGWQGGQGSYGSQGRTGRYGESSYGWQGTGQGPWGSEGYFDSGYRGMGQQNYGQEQQRGRHYGRGPRGYKRPDERIREDVNEALYRDYEVDASDIDVQVRDGEVTLNGTVDSREAKRSAEDCVWSVWGVRNVTTMLRVNDEQGRSSDQDGGRAESSNRNKKTTTAGASGS